MSTEKETKGTGLITPTTRKRFLEEWRSDPKAVIERAKDAELTLEGYAEVRSPASEGSPGDAIEFLLANEGIRTVDSLLVPSTRLDDMPDIDPVNGATEPVADLVIAHLDNNYRQTLFTGIRASAALSPLTVQGGWRPVMDAPKVRTPQIAPGFNFLSVVWDTVGISDDRYRLRRWKNATEEQKFQDIAEGTAPKLMELTRDTEVIKFNNYRAGIEWTDEFANAPETRFSDLTNAVDEIAIGHRIGELRKMGALVKSKADDSRKYSQSSVAGHAAVANRLAYPQWTHFLKQFGNAYMPNVALGSPNAITSLELMSMNAGNAITFGQWALVPNSNINSLNAQMSRLDYGWITPNSATGFSDTELYVFQREGTIVYIQQLGMNQDEMERVQGVRKTRRWLGTKSAFGISDEYSIRTIDFSTT